MPVPLQTPFGAEKLAFLVSSTTGLRCPYGLLTAPRVRSFLRATVYLIEQSPRDAARDAVAVTAAATRALSMPLPTAAELVVRNNQFTRLVRERVDVLQQELSKNYNFPALGLQPLRGLRFLPTDQRHHSELGLLSATAQEAMRSFSIRHDRWYWRGRA